MISYPCFNINSFSLIFCISYLTTYTPLRSWRAPSIKGKNLLSVRTFLASDISSCLAISGDLNEMLIGVTVIPNLIAPSIHMTYCGEFMHMTASTSPFESPNSTSPDPNKSEHSLASAYVTSLPVRALTYEHNTVEYKYGSWLRH